VEKKKMDGNFVFKRDFYLINKTFTFKLVLSGNKFGLAGNILAYLKLSANITIHNVVTGILKINWLNQLIMKLAYLMQHRQK
jgi:hypothetical protein